jgi:hypothetical protein
LLTKLTTHDWTHERAGGRSTKLPFPSLLFRKPTQAAEEQPGRAVPAGDIKKTLGVFHAHPHPLLLLLLLLPHTSRESGAKRKKGFTRREGNIAPFALSK